MIRTSGCARSPAARETRRLPGWAAMRWSRAPTVVAREAGPPGCARSRRTRAPPTPRRRAGAITPSRKNAHRPRRASSSSATARPTGPPASVARNAPPGGPWVGERVVQLAGVDETLELRAQRRMERERVERSAVRRGRAARWRSARPHARKRWTERQRRARPRARGPRWSAPPGLREVGCARFDARRSSGSTVQRLDPAQVCRFESVGTSRSARGRRGIRALSG